MNNKIFQENAKVIYTREIAENIFETMLHSPQISKSAKPGQFVNILPSIDWGSMMRRPMSIASQGGDNISIIYKVVGNGTKLMQEWETNHIVDVLGPLGNFWTKYKDHQPILIGGGVGIAPIMYLSNYLNNNSIAHYLIMGARNQEEHFLDHNLDDKVLLSTDNGSIGVKGNVLDAFKKLDLDYSEIKFFSCGPALMMENVKEYVNLNNID